ncbi:hypothetical protein [Natronorubrum texcoconense]|uniref:Uncharacterized protein n=1 Tax=Natronorubrum texcoconense TaxID=1095776 RepID=A0A1G9DZ40_9EURY|nr:hypothetical protein [Natronorubrum texcoconense]SDK69090.1 hypothetical protein SAMN04515672_3686 [Natronorubrum texcoconense]
MVDSTTNTNSGDDAFDVGASADELFGEFADESLEGAGDESTAESTTGGGNDTGADGVEDQTAADVFGQLRANAENDADEVLADESPEDIIASADEPDPEPEIDDDLRVDDDELAELLLTGRTKEKEFLWVESGASSETDADGEGESTENESNAVAEPEEETDTIFEDDTADSAAETEPATDEEGDFDSSDPGVGDLDLEDADTSDETVDAPESEETALVAKDEGDVPATVEDDGGSGGVLGWLRSKLGGLF